MAVIEKMDENLFISRFEDYDRMNKEDGKGGNFTFRALRALYNYLDDLGDDTGQNIEFDCIALCCEFSEYKNIAEYKTDYGYLHEDLTEKAKKENWTDDEFKEALEEEISNNTTLIKFRDDLDEGFIIQAY